jgi:hypothetical protein
MKLKHLLPLFTIITVAITAGGCGNNGIDRELDYSGTQSNFFKSVEIAAMEATPDQQKILLKHPNVPALALMLVGLSNPVYIEANLAKENALIFERVKKMSVRELFIWYLSSMRDDYKSTILASEQFQKQKPLTLRRVEISNVIYDSNNILHIEGSLLVSNGMDASVAVGSCNLSLVLEEIIQKDNYTNIDCSFSKKGEKSLKFTVDFRDKNTITKFKELYESGKNDSIQWALSPNYYYVNIPRRPFPGKKKPDEVSSSSLAIDDAGLSKMKRELADIEADLVILENK